MPGLSLEKALSAACGAAYIAGVDEAGRGALAGPVFAAAVVLPLQDDTLLDRLRDVRDSKMLSPGTRERLLPLISDHALAFGIGQVSAAAIDRDGILPATRQAMVDALLALTPAAAAVLVDGPIRLAAIPLPQQSIIRGDQRSLSIAAASILAKVIRDRYMADLGSCFPAYGFARHKGYGTAEHLAMLGRLGPSPEHRRTFAPLRVTLL